MRAKLKIRLKVEHADKIEVMDRVRTALDTMHHTVEKALSDDQDVPSTYETPIVINDEVVGRIVLKVKP